MVFRPNLIFPDIESNLFLDLIKSVVKFSQKSIAYVCRRRQFHLSICCKRSNFTEPGSITCLPDLNIGKDSIGIQSFHKQIMYIIWIELIIVLVYYL